MNHEVTEPVKPVFETISQDQTDTNAHPDPLRLARVGQNPGNVDLLENMPAGRTPLSGLGYTAVGEPSSDDEIGPGPEGIFSRRTQDDAAPVTSRFRARTTSSSSSSSSSSRFQPLQDTVRPVTDVDSREDEDYRQVIDSLLATVARLKAENLMLRKQASETAITSPDDVQAGPMDSQIAGSVLIQPESPIFEVWHCVRCDVTGKWNYFRDEPRWFKGDSIDKHLHLRGRIDLPNPQKYTGDNPGTAFCVVQTWKCTKEGPDHFSIGFIDGKLIADAKPDNDRVKHIEIGLPLEKNALNVIMAAHPHRFKGYDHLPGWFPAPHFFFYIHNRTLMELLEETELSDWSKKSVKLLCEWFEDECRSDWDEADELMKRGKINRKHVAKLFRPGELIVTVIEGKHYVQHAIEAAKVVSYPWSDSSHGSVDGMAWNFNGSFREYPRGPGPWHQWFNDEETEKDITSLLWYPIRFAKNGVREQLISRGNKFWNYRTRRLVCYMENGATLEHQAERRFMVDYEVHRRMHPRNPIFNIHGVKLGTEAFEKEEPPSDDFLACLPSHIHAFDLLDKQWKYIPVDQTTDVTWNKEVFKRLVLSPSTKELIQAAVTAHGQQVNAAADIIEGKGQGIIILLHGPPGTGKTLTAESIAEEQERPLYRVTCGDIGIQPAEVEVYLKQVLEISKAWRCVVLLDEADVFLEERNATDQARNAVISIFLRILEYFEGLLILTTNRVGRFDEAFKSRIQLALGYPNLNEIQREKIWLNFFELLHKDEEPFDFNDLKLNVRKLAKHVLNGRQIRNAVTMARHLAKLRNQRLVYKHVIDAVDSTVMFNKYLEDLKGASDDEFAEDGGLRVRVT